MRFEVASELVLFAESVRGAIGDVGGAARARRSEAGRTTATTSSQPGVGEAGWGELWAGDELLAAAVAGGIELGRAAAPICLVDEATLGAPLWVEGRARHGLGAASFAAPEPRGGLGLGPPSSEARPEITLDGSGTVLVDVSATGRLEEVAATACWRAWNAATLAYLAGLAERALELAVEHARTREQFGAPLGALPAVQSRLADAALRPDAVTLLAWSAATADEGLQEPALRFAGAACCRGHGVGAPGARRGRLRARDGLARVSPSRSLGRELGGRRSRRGSLRVALDLRLGPVEPLEVRPDRAQAALEGDAERLLLAAWAARACLDRLELRQPRRASAAARARAAARASSGSRSHRKNVRSAASLRTRRSGSRLAEPAPDLREAVLGHRVRLGVPCARARLLDQAVLAEPGELGVDLAVARGPGVRERLLEVLEQRVARARHVRERAEQGVVAGSSICQS